MEILSPLKVQVNRINELKTDLNLNSIISHIERAEFFFEQGKNIKDEQFYTDVVYRTNQAFEGCSRQAYMVLAEKTEQNAQNVKAFLIEKFFIDKKILNDRVLPQFKNYRDNWRNESAHNFKLFFNEEEAYFAILNVSSYAYLLFNQMISKLGFEKEKEKLRTEQINLKTIKGKLNAKDTSLKEKIIMLIEQFDLDNKIGNVNSNESIGNFISEAEIIGMLTAFITEVSENKIKVQMEKKINPQKPFRVDMYIEFQGEKLIIELKRLLNANNEISMVEQISHYLKEIGLTDGIAYVISSSKSSSKLLRTDYTLEKESVTQSITILRK